MVSGQHTFNSLECVAYESLILILNETRKKYSMGKKSCTSREAGIQLFGSGFHSCFCNISRNICNANPPQRQVDVLLSSSNKAWHNLASTIKLILLKHLIYLFLCVLSWQFVRLDLVFNIQQKKKKEKKQCVLL